MESFTLAAIMGLTIKIYALMTPPAVLSAFITNTGDMTARAKYGIAFRTSLAMFIAGETLFLFGSNIFNVFGFTLDAFRIGAGLLLFLNSIRLMNDSRPPLPPRGNADISVVPLAIPIGMGPSAIGTIMVLGAVSTTTQQILSGSLAIFLASLCMAALLCLADQVKHLIGKTGIVVMAKLTALLLSAIAAQVIFTGIRAFLPHH